MSDESMVPSDETMALVHLIHPWVNEMSDEMLCRLKSAHGEAERMFEAIFWVANNTHVPLSEIDYDAFEEAVKWLLTTQFMLRSGMKEEDSDDKRSTVPSTGSVLRGPRRAVRRTVGGG